MATPVNIEISIEGQQMPLVHSETTITINQSIFTHHSFEVKVPYEFLEGARDDGFFHEAPNNYCGKKIEIILTSSNPRNFDYPPLHFKGIITKIALSNASGNLARYFVLSGYSSSYLLEDGTLRRTFIKKSLEDIFKAVLRPYDANVVTHILNRPQHQGQVEYTVQYDETAYGFLQRLASNYGEWFYYDGELLLLGLPALATLNHVMKATDQFGMTINLKPSRFALSYADYLVPKVHEDSSDHKDLTRPDHYTALALRRSEGLFRHPARTVVQDRHVRSSVQLEIAAKERKKSQASSLVTFEGTSENLGFVLGKQVDIWNTGQALAGGPVIPAMQQYPYGSYRLTKIIHTVEAGMYKNKFQAIPASAEHPPTNPKVQPPQGVPELAEVYDVNDPEHLGRVRVCYKWDSESWTGWIRVSTPYSGHGKGQFFTPEVGSQVLVGYEHGKPDFPVVLGNLFVPRNADNANYKPGPNYNDVKGFQTAGGNKITFHDTRGQERILISNKKQGGGETKLEISFADTGAILLKTAGDIKLDAGQNIELVAGESIRMRAPVIALGAQGIELKAQKNFSLSSYQVNIDAALAHVQGGQLRLVATGQAELTGHVMTSINGAIVKIN